MAIYGKSIRIPVLISLLISAVILTLVSWYKESPVIGNILNIISWATLSIFILFLIYTFVALIFQFFKKSIWLLGIPIGVIVYFGVLLISFSQVKELIIPLIKWDINLLALGLAVFAIGFSLLSRHEPLEPDEILRQLKKHTDDLGKKVDAFSKTQGNVEDMITSVSKESQKFLESLSKIIEASRT